MANRFDFADCLARLRSRDAMTYEAAYAELLPRAREWVPQLVAELARTPQADGYSRGKLIELLGDAQHPAAIPPLARELEHPDQNVRQWAVTALVALCQAEADVLVENYRRRHPNEFE